LTSSARFAGIGANRAATSAVMSMPVGHQVMQRPQPTQPDGPVARLVLIDEAAPITTPGSIHRIDLLREALPAGLSWPRGTVSGWRMRST
jgi:hypothetical protein